jgi:environmental stress-induced protein Ves
MGITRIIRARDCPEIAWKNGGGTTREIAVFPPGADMDTFAWRLSMARVTQAGAFSAFVGIDRTLAVLDGTLRLEGPSLAVTLDPASDPFPFDGGAPIAGEPVAGPVLDLNAMARRGSHAATMLRLAAGERATPVGTTFLLALETQDLGGVRLERLDCAVIDAEMVVNGAALCIGFAAA